MGLNSPLPVKLQDESRKAAKILRSFVDSKNNGLDKVIPNNVLEKAAGFAIFTVVKAGFLVSARAGSGVVIARLPDGGWSPPSAIGLGGFGFGGQMGAEVTDFLIVLNSRSAVKSFMAAGSLTLGGNLSIAVGPLGRNAEGSGAVNSKGKVAAMYSYSKTKGLFGGVSVEGTVIIERQDANRIAYGGSVSVKEILSGQIDRPEWCNVLVDQIESSTGLPYGQKWVDEDVEGEGGAMGYGSNEFDDGYGSPTGKEKGTRSRGSSVGQGYVFGEGIGSGRNSPNVLAEKLETGRRRAGSLLGPNADKDRPVNKRSSSSFNPFSGGSTTPKRNPVLASSESYNAGLTWDSDGPMQQQTRPRSSTNPNRAKAGTGSSSRGGDEELWNNTTGAFAKMAIANGSRSRSGSNPPPFDVVPEKYDDEDFGNSSSSTPKADPFSEPAYQSPSRSVTRRISSNNIGDPYRSSSPLRNAQTSPRPKLAVKEGLDEQDGYARAIGLFDFKATAPGDLGFNKGQVVIVLGKEGGDWWKGRDTRGKEGIFPSTYVEVVELPKVPRGDIARSELKKRTPDLGFD